MRVSCRLSMVCCAGLLFVAGFVSCGGGSSNISGSSLHLYGGSVGSPGQVFQFALPLSNQAPPSATLTAGVLHDTETVAVDSSGNVAVADFSGNVAVFTGPITASTSSAVIFKNGTATSTGQLAFNGTGDLFATTNNNSINVFTHPFTSSSTPSQTITDVNLTTAVGAVVDSSGNLIVANSPGTKSNLLVFAPPYTSPAIATATIAADAYRQMTISGNQLFVVNSVVGSSWVDVYNLPITASSVPAFRITNGIFNAPSAPQTVAVDSGGNLYVQDEGHGNIDVYPPPLSSNSAPVSLIVSAGPGMAIGK